MGDELVGYRDACRITGLGESSMRSLVFRRLVPHVRISERTVRFRRSELEAWLAARSVAVRSMASART